ncbi:transglycosylase SLT domain-containing protein [Pseudomonas nitroreducens]|uniref:transglycosylase SLT domain-containing protein n=1 Tax=Pseudomonas nitroreducens TaxID=46680 RepID=UPI0014749725|nr:transglycosylase SLT domain-containing protein [Pseudomonas nitroreducens]NMZ73410.1 transglycosylase SLT domain-containing protein [Pseudomonas nitroreducens]
MGAPQIIWLLLVGLGIGAAIVEHGKNIPVSAFRTLFRSAVALALLGWGGFFSGQCHAATVDRVPSQAEQYRRVLVRAVHAEWGLSAPVATFAAQVHQESRWRADARSPVGAVGLSQFMPGTAEWISGLYPAALGANQPMNPGWALRALVTYDRYLYDRNQAASDCHRWAFVLSAYNGGQGWVNRDRRLASASGADQLAWFDSVERFNAGRSAASFRENRDYPRLILLRYERLYTTWGDGVCAERYTL